MKCPECQSVMVQAYPSYRAKGKKYGGLPGVSRYYLCLECGEKLRTYEIDVEVLSGYLNRFEEYRQKCIREIASLYSKVDYLTMFPTPKKAVFKRISKRILQVITEELEEDAA